MVIKRFLWAFALLAACLVGAQNEAQAGFNFGSFSFNSGSFALTTKGGSFSANALVTFNYVSGGIVGTPTPGFAPYSAQLTITGSLIGGTGSNLGPLVLQDVSSMTISVIGVGGPYNGSNFVSATVTGGDLFGVKGSGSATLTASNTTTPPASITYTSDFLTFPNGEKVLQFTLTQVKNTAPASGQGMVLDPTGVDIIKFASSINGQFDAEPKAHTIRPDEVVPEPASLALWSGVGGLGLLLVARRRKQS